MKHLFGLILLLTILGTGFSARAQADSSDPAALIGSWSEGSASLLQDKNTVTGQTVSSYGSSIGYRFSEDGTYQYAGLVKSTLYGCTTSLWNDNRGTYTATEGRITLKPKKDYWLSTNSCYPSSNKEKYKDPVQTTFEFETGVRNGKLYLCMRKEGNDEKILCYPRAED